MVNKGYFESAMSNWLPFLTKDMNERKYMDALQIPHHTYTGYAYSIEYTIILLRGNIFYSE